MILHMKNNFPTPSESMQPQTIQLLPSCFTLDMTHLIGHGTDLVGDAITYRLPSEPEQLKFNL